VEFARLPFAPWLIPLSIGNTGYSKFGAILAE